MKIKVDGKVFERDTLEEMIEALAHELQITEDAVEKYAHKMNTGDYKHNKTHMKDAKMYAKALRAALGNLR